MATHGHVFSARGWRCDTGCVVLPNDDVGSGPVVVLLHAGVADRTMWSEHGASIAAAGYRAIAMDLPGFGEAIPQGELAPWSDVLETLDSLGVDRATLIGNSLGGAVALSVAVAVPDRVNAMVLVSAPPIDLQPSPRLRAAWDAEHSALARGDIEGAVTAVVDAWTLPDAPEELRDRVARMQRRAFELQAAAGDLPEAEDPVMVDPTPLGRLDFPTLIAVGEFDMPDFRLGAESLAKQLRGAKQIMIADAGHLAPIEQPARFREIVLGFLAESTPLELGGR